MKQTEESFDGRGSRLVEPRRSKINISGIKHELDLSNRFRSAPRYHFDQLFESSNPAGQRHPPLAKKRLEPIGKLKTDHTEHTPLSALKEELGKILSSLKSSLVHVLLFQHFRNKDPAELEVHKTYVSRSRLLYKTVLLQEHCLLGIVDSSQKSRWSNCLKALIAFFLAVDTDESTESLTAKYEQLLLQVKDGLRNSREISEHLNMCLQERFSMTPIRKQVQSLLERYALALTTKCNASGVTSMDKISYMTCPAPFLPPGRREQTLVLDLDETLVHYSELRGRGQVNVRPFVQQFLEEMHQFFEVVVFTAAMPDYANWILNIIDIRKSVDFRLFRHHSVFTSEGIIKDLSKLGRGLGKVFIVDNLKENFRLQPENGIEIKTWTGEPDDKELQRLMGLLPKLATYEDVRVGLKELKLSAQ